LGFVAPVGLRIFSVLLRGRALVPFTEKLNSVAWICDSGHTDFYSLSFHYHTFLSDPATRPNLGSTRRGKSYRPYIKDKSFSLIKISEIIYFNPDNLWSLFDKINRKHLYFHECCRSERGKGMEKNGKF
jgi:hypothetical protein